MGSVSASVVTLRGVFCVHRTGQGDAAALQGLDLGLDRGEVLCVLGPSGAGKSTLLRVTAGLQPPSAGAVELMGRDIGRMDARRRAAMRHRHLAFLGQSSQAALPPGLAARQTVMLPLALRGVGRRLRAARADELLEAVGLGERDGALADELSGGERQRVALCAALAHAPDVLLADEPTGDLDRPNAELVYRLTVALARSSGASAIIASHDRLAARYADRVIELRDGRVVEERRGDAATLVVDRGGWVRLPDALRAATQLSHRVAPRAVDGGLLLSPVGDAQPGAGSPQPRAARGPNSWPPAEVRVEGLGRSYGRSASGRPVLGRLTHSFATGRLTVVTGRSGSGKTTLLRLIGGLDRPTAGEITVDGHPLSARDGEQLAELRRRQIGFMSQDPAPVGFLSAHENVVLALRMRGWDQGAADRTAADVLGLAGLSERAGQRVSRLSAGETQRVALARALAGARGLLVIDEPTSRLDEANAATVATLLAHAASVQGQTIICTSHDPAIIAEADAVLALDG
jgi:peptide/nickel transport system ATP-binding protein/energy-coupling factor transport system ATP-binding protein